MKFPYAKEKPNHLHEQQSFEQKTLPANAVAQERA
jgi:hypothetical protein